MSKKNKLILATALFGAALFGASCGGGGGGTTAGTGTGGGTGGGGGGGGGGSQPPPASVEGRVLALLNVGTASAGTLMPVTICELKDDNKAHCGNDLNPSENADLNYLHEFPNGNVVLRGTGGVLYFFNAQNNTLTKLTNFRALGATSTTTVATGITIPAGSIYHATANFLYIYNNNDLVAISNTGNVIRDDNVADINPTCEKVTKGASGYKLNTNGTSTTTTIPTPRASAGGKFLVSLGPAASSTVYLSDSNCELANPVTIGTFNNVADAKMVEFGGNYYIAIRYQGATGAGRDINYYRVTGTTVTGPLTGGALALRANDRNLYDITGVGYLYYNVNDATHNDHVRAVAPDGTHLAALDLSGAAGGRVDGLIAFNDRVLARDDGASAVYSVYIAASGSLASTNNPAGADLTVLQRCTDINTRTRSVDGVGTNFIRCVYESGGSTTLHSLTYDSNFGYASASSSSISGSYSGAKWATNKVLVSVGSSIRLCSTTTTPSISCSATDLPDLNTTLLKQSGTDRYLKSNGNNVFYAPGGTSPKVGDIFGTQTTLPIAVSSPSGGNASFDLTKFAFSFKPAGAACNTRIAYFSSPTANPKLYALPSGACVERILKVY